VPGSAGLDRPGALAFNPAGTVLAASTQNGTVRLWPLAGAFTRPPPAVVIGTRHADDFNQDAAVAFSPDSRLLATGGSSSEIQLWNVGDPRHPAIVGAPLAGHSGSVAHLAFAAGGTTLASAGTDRTVRLWDVRDAGNAVPLGPPLTGHAEKAVFVAFGPGAGSLLSLGNAGSVRLWRRPAARAVTGRRVTALAFSADGAELVAGEEDGAVHRWPVAAGPALGAATTVLPGNRDDTVAEVLSVRLTAGRLSMVDEGARLTGGTGGLCPGTCPVLWPDQLFVAALGPDGSVVVFSPLKRDDDLDQVFVYAAGMAAPAGLGYPPPGRFQGIDAIAFRPDGRLVAVGDISGNIRIWEVTGRKPAGPVLSGHADGLTDLAFAPDGRTLVSTSFDRTVRVWQLTDEGVGSPRALVTGLDDFADSAAFAPDGSLFATAGEEGSVRLWDPATAAAAGPPIRPQDNEAEFVRWSPDGRLLAVAGERSIGLIDLDPERAIARICAATTWIGPQQWRTRVSPELPYADVCA
jgi:WD40 repeat protein